MYQRNIQKTAAFQKGIDTGGHPTDDQILPIQLDSLLMQSIGQRLHGVIGCTDLLAEKFLAPCPEILLKIQWIEGDSLHLTDWKRVMLTVDRHPKQAPGRRDMELRRLLAEILQGGQRALAGLDLIENDQRLPRNDALPGGRLQIPQEALRLNILIEGDNNSIIFGKGVIVNASKVQPTVMNALGGCKIMIGDGSLFSNNIEIHTTDYHGIYDEHGKRINPDKDIYIGNRVWCGLGCKILKGTNILDGTIIGAGSIVTGKIKEKNVIIAGNPAKIIKRQVFWNEKRLDSCMHMPKDLM